MPDIRHAIVIDEGPESVRPLVATALGFKQWWAADVRENPAAPADSRNVDLGFFNRATVYSLKPLKSLSANDVEWLCESGKEWQGTKLIFRLTPKDKGTAVHFTHADWESETDYFISCNTTWGELMFRLKAAAEGKQPGPLFSNTGIGY
jgi:hypothetical protein